MNKRFAPLAMLGAGFWPATGMASEPSAAGGFAQMLVGLAVVLAVIGIAAWLLRRLGRLPAGMQGVIRIHGGVSLGARERAVLVQVGETQLLLGIAPGRVQTLHVFAQPVVTERSVPPSPAAFAERLAALLSKSRRQS